MNVPDLINGGFELAGAIATAWNVVTLCRHKQVRGVSSVTYWYFFSWGVWNLVYYPGLHQWLSFSGGVALVVSNGLYAGLSLYFIRREKHGIQNSSRIRRKGSGQAESCNS